MPVTTLEVRGQPALRLAAPGAGECTLALHGAQLLSWIDRNGDERLYLSERAAFDGKTAIRGGVPVCWPQFNTRGPLAKHGFARNLPWTPQCSEQEPNTASLVLHDDEGTRAQWPHGFRLVLRARLAADGLRIALSVQNTGHNPWTFAAALHTYLRVDDLADVRLAGLQGAQRWDAVRDERHVETEPALAFGEEFDSVYAAPAEPLRLVEPGRTLRIAQSASCTETVVWNPGPALCARLPDMPADGWRHMLCVEAARIDEPVMLAPGGSWDAWQELRLG